METKGTNSKKAPVKLNSVFPPSNCLAVKSFLLQIVLKCTQPITNYHHDLAMRSHEFVYILSPFEVVLCVVVHRSKFEWIG